MYYEALDLSFAKDMITGCRNDQPIRLFDFGEEDVALCRNGADTLKRFRRAFFLADICQILLHYVSNSKRSHDFQDKSHDSRNLKFIRQYS